MTGEWPKDQIDHINRVKDDDRWENLREATQSQNSYNRAWAERNGDLRGVRRHGRKFRVDVGGSYLRLFNTLEEAKSVRDKAHEKWAGPFVIKQEAS
jgi:hypothetical protein